MNSFVIPLSIGGLDFFGLDSDLAIYLLIFISAASLWTIRASALSWTWHLILKSAVIILTGYLALFVGPRWLFATLSWSFFLAFYLLPAILQKIYYKQIMQLNDIQALKLANLMRWIYWGKSGEFLYYSTLVFQHGLKGDKNATEVFLSKWHNAQIPETIKNQLIGLRFQNYVLLRQWESIIDEYETAKKEGNDEYELLYFYASRAYIELSKLDEAADCIASAKPVRLRNDAVYLSLTLFYFYCLAGLSDEANQILTIIVSQKYNLPKYIIEYWLARLDFVQGNYDKALNRLDQAYKLASPSWRSRIEAYKNFVLGKVNIDKEKNKALDNLVSVDPEKLSRLGDIFKELEKYISAQEIFYPTKKSRTISLLILSILLVFFFADSYFLFPNDLTNMIGMVCYKQGMLIPRAVFAGEYWRLFTSIFLHVNLVHALVNILALFLFGRMVVGIYGSANFLLIFFVSGILSGLSQAIFCPALPCIGASGAVMGAFGAAIVGVFRLRKFLPVSVSQKELKRLAIILVVQLVADQLIPHIGVSAHLGGLLAGAFLGLLLPISKIIKKQLVII